MKPSLVIYGVAAILAAAATFWSLMASSALRVQLDAVTRLRAEADRHREISSENAQLRAALNALGGADDAKAGRRKLDALRHNLNEVQIDLRNLERARGEKPDPVWPDGAVVLRAQQWENVGAASPANAMQSFLWAARAGDIDQVANLITLQPRTKAQAASAFEQLPAATQSQFGTPEKMIATYVAAKIPDYDATAQIGPSEGGGPYATADYRMEDTGGGQRDFTFLFQKSPEGTWQLAVPQLAVANYIADLQGKVAQK